MANIRNGAQSDQYHAARASENEGALLAAIESRDTSAYTDALDAYDMGAWLPEGGLSDDALIAQRMAAFWADVAKF